MEGSQKLFQKEDNPIMNPVILDLVFELLQVSTLQNCRFVCHKWLEPATRKMLLKSSIVLDAENVKKLLEIEKWTNSYSTKLLFRNLTCDKITHSSYPNIWPLLGDHVKSFTVSHWWDDSKDLTLADYEDLLLNRCPQLEEIVMPCTKNFKKAHKFLLCPSTAGPKDGELLKKLKRDKDLSLNLKIIRVTGNAKPSVKFWRIISLSPKLYRLHIECQLIEEFWNPNLQCRPHWIERMKNLQEMEIRSYANEGASDTSAHYYISTPWNLKSAAYELYDAQIMSDTSVKDMHEHIKHSLEKLQMTFFNRHYLPWPADKGQDWITSPKMTKLKFVKVEIDQFCQGPIFCRALVHSMFLPNLERLILSMYEEGENQTEWEDGLFNQVLNDCLLTTDTRIKLEDLIRPKLRVLTLPPKMRDESCIPGIAKIFPNLNELSLELPEPKFMTLILYHFKKLKRLKVTLDTSDDYGTNWNYLLIGYQIMMGEDGCIFGGFNGASVINFQNLNSLEIKMVESSGNPNFEKSFLNDLFIYHGLVYLKCIQHISIEGHEFSNEAINFLKTHLLPFCHIDF